MSSMLPLVRALVLLLLLRVPRVGMSRILLLLLLLLLLGRIWMSLVCLLTIDLLCWLVDVVLVTTLGRALLTGRTVIVDLDLVWIVVARIGDFIQRRLRLIVFPFEEPRH